MAQLQQSHPDYQPSTDLLGKLTLAEAEERLTRASDASQWGEVIETAAGAKMLMTCAYLDAMWRTAEALVRTDDEGRALEAYRYILANCAKPEERLATVQKASQLIKSPEALERLLQMGRRLPNGRSEFESVRFDLLRQKIGEAAANATAPAPSPTEIDALAAQARNTGALSDQQLLGWYAYSRQDYAQAESWFRLGLKPNAPDPKAAEGLVLALRADGKLPEAQKLAVAYAPLGPLNRKIMTETLTASLDDPKAAPLSADDLAALVKAIDEAQSAEGAASYGWRLYKDNDFAGAQGWFAKSAGWRDNESAAVGLVVCARRQNAAGQYAQLVAKYRATYPKIADFDTMMRAAAAHAPRHYARRSGGGDAGWDHGADAIVKVMQTGDYKQTVAMIDARKQAGRPQPGGLLVVQGWALYHYGDWEGAKKAFAEAAEKGHAQEADDGLATIRHAELPKPMP